MRIRRFGGGKSHGIIIEPAQPSLSNTHLRDGKYLLDDRQVE
jgi:hypothetical protein